jgi:type VI secretion system protein ImpH
VSAEAAESLKRALVGEGHRFSFYQVLRLVRCLLPPAERRQLASAGSTAVLRAVANLSLAFPAADIDRVEIERRPEDGGERFTVVANFLGLMGTGSPLPTFYTEDLIAEEAADEKAARELFQLVNHRLYAMLFQCWGKYRLPLRLLEEEDRDTTERLFCLAGLGDAALRARLPAPFRLLRYLGLLTQFPRSASGLTALLADALPGVPVRLTPCVLRMAPIPREQRLALGTERRALGRDTYLGDRIADRMGKFRIHLGPVTNAEFHRLVPGRANFTWLVQLTALYVTEPLECEIEIILAAGEARSVRLGDPGCACLGVDSWIFSGPSWGEVSARFAAPLGRRRPPARSTT